MLIRFIDRVPVLKHTHVSYCWLCTSNIPLHPFLPYIYIIHSQILVGDETTHESPFHASAFTRLRRKTAMLAAPPSIPGHLSLWEPEIHSQLEKIHGRCGRCMGMPVGIPKREYNGSKFKAPTTESGAKHDWWNAPALQHRHWSLVDLWKWA